MHIWLIIWTSKHVFQQLKYIAMFRKSAVKNMVLSIFILYLGFKYYLNVKESTNTRRQFALVFRPAVALRPLGMMSWACRPYSCFLCCRQICRNVLSHSRIFLSCPSLCNLRNLKRHLEGFTVLKEERGKALLQEIQLLVQMVIEHHKVLCRAWRRNMNETCPE